MVMLGRVWLCWAKYWYNTSFQSAISKPPFEIVYGRPPPVLHQFLQTRVKAVPQHFQDRDEILRQLKFNLLRVQQIMKKSAKKHQRDLEFSVGDHVFLKLRPNRQHSVVTRVCSKLSACHYGPFEVVARIGAVAYKLKLPATSKIHPFFIFLN